MNKWQNGIISVYKRKNSVVVFPRWVKNGGYECNSKIYKYEIDSVYRSVSGKVNSIKLPLALY